MPRLHIERPIAAEPTSVALLLAGPAGPMFWPGVDEVQGGPEPHLVRAHVPGRGPVTVSVTAGPPLRTPTAFVVGFRFGGDDVPDTTATLSLHYRPPSEDSGPAATVARLRFDYPGPFAERLRRLGETFLANVAAAAEDRARAA